MSFFFQYLKKYLGLPLLLNFKTSKAGWKDFLTFVFFVYYTNEFTLLAYGTWQPITASTVSRNKLPINGSQIKG